MRDIYYNGLQLNNSAGVFLTGTSGLDIKMNVQTTANAYLDGGTISSNQMPVRNITLSLLLNSIDNVKDVYSAFKIKQVGKFMYDSKYINCYVENITVNVKDKPMTAFVSLLCPQPYFKDLSKTISEIVSIVPNFEFPVEFTSDGIEFGYKSQNLIINVINGGDVETGMLIHIKANGSVTNPKLVNVNTQEYVGINKTISAGDNIYISTIKGNKYIKMISSDEIESNIINDKLSGSKFLQIAVGDNLFKYDATENKDNMEVWIEFESCYAGVDYGY